MTYFIPGSILILFGFLHVFNEVQAVEPKIILYIQQTSNRKSLLAFFKEIWFFGRTSFTLIMLVLLSCVNWKMGGLAAGIFLIIIGIEYLIKTLYTRIRPYAALGNISMHQPTEPKDSSFPSGDTMRAWYLALIISSAAGGGPAILIAALTLAVLVTLGRLIMGVHYLTDTLTGAGMGILGAGATIWLWKFVNFL
jgi:membrane-associated phospholipid phosphatase